MHSAKQFPHSCPTSEMRGTLSDYPQRYHGNLDKYKLQVGFFQPTEDINEFIAQRNPVDCPSWIDSPRIYTFLIAFDQVIKEGIIGDLAELGVYRGATGLLLAKMARRIGTTAYLIDTYEGFSSEDLIGIDAHHRTTEFCDTSIEVVRANVGTDNVEFIKGHFPESAAQMPPDRSFCLVHLDCDLYAPTRSALEYFYPRLLPAGFFIIHDYGSLYWDSVEKAVDEFFADKHEAIVPIPDRGGSVIIRKTKAT